MDLFGQKWSYSGNSGYIRAKAVIIGQKWLYSIKSGSIRACWLYSGNVAVFGETWLCSGPNTTTFARIQSFLPEYNRFSRIQPLLFD